VKWPVCGDVEYWQNLLEKPTEREYYTDNAVAMVQCKVLKQLQLLEGRKIDDQDIVDDVNFLNETLQASVQDLRFVAGCMSADLFETDSLSISSCIRN